MSSDLHILGAPFTFVKLLDSTNLTTVFEVPAGHDAYGIGVELTNVDTSNTVDITLQYTVTTAIGTYKPAGTYNLLTAYTLATKTPYYRELNGLHLVAGDLIKATASAANDVNVIGTVVLLRRRQ